MTRRALVALLLLTLIAPVFAHELQANRLTLVLRERHHVSMTFLVSYNEALHRALAPQRTYQEFVLEYSAMRPQEFRRRLLGAQAKFEKATHLGLPDGKEAAIRGWNWPDPGRVQATLQELVMQAVVKPGGHPQEAVVEIHVEATTTGDIASVSLQLPEEFQPMLVVSYRPSQVWVKAGTPSTAITF